MILLQTLTRVHVCFVLLAAQSLGSIATICARGFAPDKVGPAGVFPAVGSSVDKIGSAWFWIALFFQLLARLVNISPFCSSLLTILAASVSSYSIAASSLIGRELFLVRFFHFKTTR